MSKQNILILVLAGGGGGHDQNRVAQQLTWAAAVPSNFKVFWIVANPNLKHTEISIKNSEIRVPALEIYSNLLAKTLLAFKSASLNFDFDYVIRTNTSCYFSFTEIEKTINDLESSKNLYAGVKGSFISQNERIDFISGSGIWLSRDNVEEICLNLVPEEYNGLVDDVAIGKFLGAAGKPLLSLPRVDITDFKPATPGAHSRVKHWELDPVTQQRMHSLHQIYSSNDVANAVKEFDLSEINLLKQKIKKFDLSAIKSKKLILSTQEQRIASFQSHLNRY